MSPLFARQVLDQHCSSSSSSSSSASHGGGGSAAASLDSPRSMSSAGSLGGGGGGGGCGGGMSFASFARFVAAWEERGHPGSLRYFFPVLDLRGEGCLTPVSGCLPACLPGGVTATATAQGARSGGSTLAQGFVWIAALLAPARHGRPPPVTRAPLTRAFTPPSTHTHSPTPPTHTTPAQLDLYTLLREVANRLKSVLRADDLAARLGGDEFAVLVLGAQADKAARSIATRVTELLAEPFSLAGQTVHLGGSIGVAVYPEDAGDAAGLLRNAEIALCRAQAEGRGLWRRFDPAMQAEIQARRELECDLRDAMANNELEAWFQPLLSLYDRRITGFEALMRWRHPTRGLVPPTDFIALAEEIGLITPLGEWMLEQACKVAASLPEEISIAVNVSAVQFRTPGLVGTVVRALASNGVPAHRLEIEVTESVLMDDQPLVFQTLRQLRDLGVRLALDDFGTGFASLAYLQRFPFDKIKIDRSFIVGLPNKQSSVAIISAVTALANQLGMITTAEGVETEDQLEMVTALGCTQGQGYLIGKPSARPLEFLAPPRVVELRRVS